MTQVSIRERIEAQLQLAGELPVGLDTHAYAKVFGLGGALGLHMQPNDAKWGGFVDD